VCNASRIGGEGATAALLLTAPAPCGCLARTVSFRVRNCAARWWRPQEYAPRPGGRAVSPESESAGARVCVLARLTVVVRAVPFVFLMWLVQARMHARGRAVLCACMCMRHCVFAVCKCVCSVCVTNTKQIQKQMQNACVPERVCRDAPDHDPLFPPDLGLRRVARCELDRSVACHYPIGCAAADEDACARWHADADVGCCCLMRRLTPHTHTRARV
jgi:hypothetical protein